MIVYVTTIVFTVAKSQREGGDGEVRVTMSPVGALGLRRMAAVPQGDPGTHSPLSTNAGYLDALSFRAYLPSTKP